MAIDGDNGRTSTVGGGNTGYNWSGYAEWLAKTKNSTKTCNLIVNYYANGYNGSAAENPPPSSVRSYTGQSVDVRLVVEVASGDTMSNPGYIFVGWATSNNTPTVTYNPGDTISNSWAADYRGNSVTNLYAVWTNQNVITYNPDDNSVEKSAIYQVKQSGQSATLKGATFTRTGYTQTGWATTAGGPKVYNLGGTYSSNNPLSLYPVWQANTYTITYVANEGTGTMADQTVTYDSTFTPRACSFTREGYSFSSWNESQDGKGIRWKVQEYTVDRAENITLYAIWKGNEYIVYYDDNYSRYSDEITGDIVTFESEYAQPLKKAEVSISPIQDLHGYSSPWIGTDYDQQPYNFRAVSSSSVSPLGNSEMGNIVGGTVAWNQLVTTGKRTESVTPNGTYTYSTSSVTVSAKANHVYFIAMTVKNYNGGKTLRGYCQINAAYGMPAQDLTGTSKAFAWLCKSSTGSASINYGLSNLATADKLTSADAWTRDDTQIFDLTAMFGSTIADYLYGLESGTAGAGIAKLKSWGFCTKPYYAYDAGTLLSVNTSAHKTVGFNQWDEQWEVGQFNPSTGEPQTATNAIRTKNPIHILPNTTYFLKATDTSLRIFYCEEDGTMISTISPTINRTFTTTDNVHYLKFHTATGYGATYKNDICINLSKTSGTPKNGDYVAYAAHTYALDDVELRGIPKLDANNNLYYDGDSYLPDGTVTRKYGVYTITGNEGWQYYSAQSYFYCTANIGAVSHSNLNLGNAVMTEYLEIGGMSGSVPDSVFTLNTTWHATNNFYIKDTRYNGDTIEDFKAHIAGMKLVYKLATPTTETATAYAATQSIDPDGTEEYVDYAESQGTRDVAIPVGHYTNYANICPISGRTGLTAYRTGKNLWGGERMADDIVAAISTSSKGSDADGRYVDIKASSLGDSPVIASGMFNANMRYTVILKMRKSDTRSASNLGFIYTDGTVGYITLPGPPTVGVIYTAVVTSAVGKTVKSISGIWASGTAYVYYDESGVFEGVVGADDFVSYNGNTYSSDWTSTAGTVYGGTLDVVTGVLTVDWAMVVYDGTESWRYFADYHCVVCNKQIDDIQISVPVVDYLNNYGLICHRANAAGNTIQVGSNRNPIEVVASSADEWKALLQATPLQVVYDLATPLTYQLTAQEIEALVGTNNVWSDVGPITIVYALDEVPQNMPPSTAIFGDIFYTRRNQLSRFGLTFKGWNTVPDGSGEAWLPSGVSMGTYKRTEDAVWNVSHNVTLYAQWDPNVYPFGTVFFNGRNAQDLGIIVEELPSYYYAERAFNHKQVNGKNGDVILDTGRYENVKKVYKVACYDPSRNFYESAVALSTFLHSAGSDYIRLEDSYEPSSYRMAIYEETNEIENLLGKAGRCEITFNCMPQRFLLSGDEEITIPSSGYSIYNPTAFDAKPMIRIQGTGTVTINGRSVHVTENDNDMLVDCENQNAKDLSGADMNYFIYCDEFPVLKPGFNTISYTETIDAVKITPRWWIL